MCNAGASNGGRTVGPVAFRYQGSEASPCQYIDTTRKAIDCATTLPLPVIGRPFVKRFALCYRSVVCLSVTFMHCGQTVGRIKMKLGKQVGLGPGDIVLGGTHAAPPPLKGHSHFNFRPISVVAKWLHGSRCHLVWR